MIRNTIVPPSLSGSVFSNFTYERPEEFLNLAVFDPGVTEIFTALVAVFPHTSVSGGLSGINYVAFHGDVNSGNISIDWGDGSTETLASGGTTYHIYDFNDLSSTTEFRGYRQVVLSAVPETDGSKFTHMDTNQNGPFDPSYTSEALRNGSNLLDITMSSSLATDMDIGGNARPHKMCEKVGLYNTSSNRLTNAQTSIYSGFTRLQDIPHVPYMHTDTTESHSEAFAYCQMLRVLPDDFADPDRYWFWNSTSFYRCFFDNHSLKYLPEGLFDKRGQQSELSNCSDMRGMFMDCRSIEYIPNLPVRTSGNTSMQQTFHECIELKRVPKGFHCKFPGSADLDRTFYNTVKLEDFGDFTLADLPEADRGYHVFNMQGTFRNCGRQTLEEIPWLGVDPIYINNDTDPAALGIGFTRIGHQAKRWNEEYFTAGFFDLTNIVDLQDNFNFNKNIERYPLLKFAPNKLTNSNAFFRVFFDNNSLQTLNFSGFATNETFGNGEYYQSFYNCFQLKSLSGLPWNAANDSGDYSGVFTNVRSLAHIGFPGNPSDETGFSQSISLQYMPLTREECVNIFRYLVTVGGKTITLTNNNFADDLTADELAIATDKGWTVSR